MIYCKELDKEFKSKDEMFIALKDNLTDIISAKKAIIKHSDSYNIVSKTDVNENTLSILKNITQKSLNSFNKSIDFTKEATLPNLIVTSIANTTNWFDSHRDVHIDGIWNKTLADNSGKGFYHLQEHENEFAKIISSNAKVVLVNTTFKALGFNFEGTTQALVGESNIDPNRNIFMYNQYANGWVDNHSVGMRYVKLLYCADTNVDDMKEYKDNYDKYYSLIANKADVDNYGYFYAVLEAKLCEYSAVPKGSNEVTPTISVVADKSQNSNPADKSHSQAEEPPVDGTQTTKRRVFIN